MVLSSRNLGCVQVKCYKIETIAKNSRFSGHFKYARAYMRIGRYAPAYDRNVGRGEVSSGFGTMYTNKVKNNSHENIQAWLFFSGWYASLRSYNS